MAEKKSLDKQEEKKSLVALYATFSQLSIHYSNLLNNYRILVFSACTVLLAAAGNIAFNKNTASSLYFNTPATVQSLAPILILVFTIMVNFSIHQMIVVIHDKYKLAEENLIILEKALGSINFGKKSKSYRDEQSRFYKITKYYGTSYVIYLACLVLIVAIIVNR